MLLLRVCCEKLSQTFTEFLYTDEKIVFKYPSLFPFFFNVADFGEILDGTYKDVTNDLFFHTNKKIIAFKYSSLFPFFSNVTDFGEILDGTYKDVSNDLPGKEYAETRGKDYQIGKLLQKRIVIFVISHDGMFQYLCAH